MPGAKVKLGKDWDEGVLVITYSLLVSGTRKSVVRPGDLSAVEFALLPVPQSAQVHTRSMLPLCTACLPVPAAHILQAVTREVHVCASPPRPEPQACLLRISILTWSALEDSMQTACMTPDCNAIAQPYAAGFVLQLCWA